MNVVVVVVIVVLVVVVAIVVAANGGFVLMIRPWVGCNILISKPSKRHHAHPVRSW